MSYDPTTNTLTLNNSKINRAYNTTGYNDTVCIYSEANTPLILNLIGENIITGVDAVQSSYGIRCSGKLTIEGDGSLAVISGKGGSGWSTNNDSSAILTQGGLTINDTTLYVNGEQNGLFGFINNNITINGSTVTAYGSNYAIRGYLNTNGQKVSVMVGDKEPGEEWDGSTSLTYNYKYVNIELDPYIITDIAMTNATFVHVNTDLILEGTVFSNTNTSHTIIWSVEDANGTGARINDGTFRATSEGTAKVKASVINGLTARDNFTKTFDITVTAVPVVTHTITATVTTGGSISPSGSVTVNKGENQTFTITPNSNYSIGDVTVDGVSIGAISTYTFSSVTGDHTISATFKYNGSGKKTPSKSNSTIDDVGYNESSFNDVKSDAYYMGYIEWASKNNIVKGIGNGNFAPIKLLPVSRWQ